MSQHLALIDSLRREVIRLREREERRKLVSEALNPRELRDMLEEHAEIVYRAVSTRPTVDEKYRTLVRLCDAKRSYEVPPEYSGVLNVEERRSWTPVDSEIARVLVATTIPDPGAVVLYADLVKRIDATVSTARPHIYRSLKVILRETPERGSIVNGIRLR